MTIDDVVASLKRIENDITIEGKEILNEDMTNLPFYIKDLVYELEDLMMGNNDYFNHILAKLSGLGYKHKYVNLPHEKQIHIITNKGNLVLI